MESTQLSPALCWQEVANQAYRHRDRLPRATESFGYPYVTSWRLVQRLLSVCLVLCQLVLTLVGQPEQSGSITCAHLPKYLHNFDRWRSSSRIAASFTSQGVGNLIEPRQPSE
jgi:hypothetical protein